MTSTLPYLGYILEGLVVTISVSLAIFASATLVGMVVVLGSQGEKGIKSFAARGYISLFRAVPELLWVFIVYYGTDVVMAAFSTRLGIPALEVSPFVAVTAALGIQFGAYCAEIFGDARRAIPRGMFEAADALGLEPLQIIRRVTLPLMLVNATPALGNLFLVILKVSALASVIGLEELTRRAKIVAGATREPFVPYLVAAACFLLVTAVASIIQHRIERRTQFGRRPAHA